MQIRPAIPADAEPAAILLFSAYTHVQLTFPLREEPDGSFIGHLERSFAQAGNRFSYQQIEVAEVDGAVAGLLLSFGGRDEARLNAAVGPWLQREAHDDEWYIDALAVFSNWARQGLGAGLLGRAEELAAQHGYPKLALNAAEDNAAARHLYERAGYAVTEQTVLYERPFVRMVKPLGA